MRDFELLVKKTFILAGFLLVVVGMIILLGYRTPVLLGGLTGTAVSIWSGFFLAARLKKMPSQKPQTARASMQVGFVFRFGLILAVLYLASRVDWLSITGVALGIFAVPVISTWIVAASLLKEQLAARAGEKPRV